ncbi:MAG: PAS domain-containing hybrid sensor histidine kinase/response regulator [Pseudomonadota bacterium]
MTTPSYLLGLAALYVCALFVVAWVVDRRGDRSGGGVPRRLRTTVYVLSLGVYCSSWTFYGAVGSSVASPWSHAPIYLGPILVFALGWPMIERLVRLGPRHRVTSVADYLSARFGKRQALSVLVTLVATAAVLPYVALQFRALSQAWLVTVGATEDGSGSTADPSLVIAVVLAAFSILFGARRMDGRERHPGMMSAVALESVVKLLAFSFVALFALSYLFGGTGDSGPSHIDTWLRPPTFSADFFAQIFISACAVLCLPRQFHVMVVEARENKAPAQARWFFPAYLLLFMLLVVPISLAGARLSALHGGAAVNPDAYVQWLPLALDSPFLLNVAFIGGISAATSMVIVATVSLAIMITNELAVPLMIRSRAAAGPALLALGNRVRRIRQLTIALIIAASWLVATQLHGVPWLTEIGFISFLAAAQLAPGIVASLYWRPAHGVALMVGLLAGLAFWFYSLVLPTVLGADHALIVNGPLGIALLRPTDLFGVDSGDSLLAYATAWSLGANLFFLVTVSRLLRPAATDLRQAAVFLDAKDAMAFPGGDDFDLSPVRAGQLRALLPPFLDGSRARDLWRSFEERYQQRILPADRVPVFAVREAESELAGVLGSASAHRVIQQLVDSRQVDFAELASLVSDAGRQQTFNRALLESTIQSMQQGVAVVDAQLRLVAWNSRYEEIFEYPERMLYVGIPVARLYRYNAERGIMAVGKRSIDDEVEKRLNWLRKAQAHRFERRLPDGRVIDIYGIPMPEGGIVTTYSDITEYRELVTELEETRAELENRLQSGNRSLSDTNAELRRENRLRAEAESRLREAGMSKSRFMSATSHDLLQPINAARLFTAALKQDTALAGTSGDTIASIDKALGRAEQMISELREIARLDSGRRQPTIATFSLDALLRDLYAEFAPEAKRRGLRLRLRSSSLWIHSDRQLLTRALQNLVSNAINYSRAGTVLLGARRRGTHIELQVIDQGPGITDENQARIFEEFQRLTSRQDAGDGLGLGLSIVKRYAELLELPLRLHSEPGRGSVFSLTVPRGEPVREEEVTTDAAPRMEGRLSGVSVLCIDNDPQVRDALAAILAAEGCRVTVVADRHGLRDALKAFRPDVVLADYHLDEGDTGIAALQWALRGANRNVPCVIVSADDGRDVREAARAAGYRILHKPINPTRLTALIFALAGAEQAMVSAPGSGRARVPQEA